MIESRRDVRSVQNVTNVKEGEGISGSDLARAKAFLIERVVRAWSGYGLSQKYGVIYGELFFRTSPASLTEIAAATNTSKSAASVALRQLESWGYVKRSIRTGGRQDFYEIEPDFGKAFSAFMTNQLSTEITVMLEASARVRQALDVKTGAQSGSGTGEGGESEVVLRRVRDLATFYEKLRDFLAKFQEEVLGPGGVVSANH